MADVNNENTQEKIRKYYEKFFVSDVRPKDKHLLKSELMYQLFQTPQREDPKYAVHTLQNQDQKPNVIHQMDLLYLPTDSSTGKDYKYALTIVDCGSRDIAVIPLQTHSAKEVLASLKKLYKEKKGLFKKPEQIQVDSGSEFKGVFAKYCKDNNIYLRVAKPGRSREQALVESRNGVIARALLRNMVMTELNTNEESRDWIEYLKEVVVSLNKHYHREPIHLQPDEIMADFRDKPGTELLENGTTQVRVALDKPIDLMGNKQHGKFRQGDIRWSLKPSKVERIQLKPDQPALYKVEGYTPLYTRNQLQVVPPVSNLPPARNTYIIEKIVDKRKKNNRIEYLIKWQNYPDTDNTWEPRKELIKTSKDLIKDYDKAHK